MGPPRSTFHCTGVDSCHLQDVLKHPAESFDFSQDHVRLVAPFLQGANSFSHGVTFGGHPVASAVALANLDIFEREDLNGHVRANSALFRSYLERLNDLPIVGDVRGDGYFFGIELVKDRRRRRPSTTTSPSGCCAGSCPRRCSTPGCTAARTTAATPSSSSRRR